MPQSQKQILIEHTYDEIRLFMKSNHIKSIDLAKAMNRTEQAISNQLRRKLHFTKKSAERLADGFAKLGKPINISFLLTGRGLISDNPEHNPNLKSERHVVQYTNMDGKVQTLSSSDYTKLAEELEQVKKERDAIYEQYLIATKENESLKKRIEQARHILRVF